MATIDNAIKNVGTFNGNLQEGRRDYERAKQGSELIEKEMSALEERLKAETGYDSCDLPDGKSQTEIKKGDVTFEITSISRTKRPQYKTAVTEMENYLDGISFLLSEGRTITGVMKEGRKNYVAVDKLLESFEIISAGIMVPEVKHTISYKVEGALSEENPLDEILLSEGRNPAALTEENFANYIRMSRIGFHLEAYVKKYEKELSKGQRKKEKVTAVTTKSAYETTKSTATGVDWAHVVTTIVTVPTNALQPGELNILADESVSKAEKERQMPTYQLNYHEVRGSKKLYVSLQSVYRRIQELKEEQSVESKRLKVEPKEVV